MMKSLVFFIIAILPFPIYAQIDSIEVVDNALKEAIMHFDGKRYEMAFQQLNTAIDYNTRGEVADVLFYYRALTNLQLNDKEAAMNDLNLAIASIENESLEKPHYYMQRAELLYNKKEFVQAKSDLEKVTLGQGKKEEKSRAYMLIGTIAHRNGNTPLSLENFNKAIELDDSNADAFYYRAFVYFEFLQTQTACANLSKAASLGHEAATLALKTYCKD